MSEWVSIKEAAERLGVSADTIRRRMKRGELVSRKRGTAQGYVWEIEVESLPVDGEPMAGEQPAPGAAADSLELERLRERVTGLERERGELIAQRDAWHEQVRRSSDAEAQLRELVLRAQMLAQALPASTEDDRQGEMQPERPQSTEQMPPQASIWARLFGRSQGM